MAEQIPINPSILKWAREKAGYTLEEECKKNSKHEEWENGISYPTYSQLEKLSIHYNRPLAILALSQLRGHSPFNNTAP